MLFPQDITLAQLNATSQGNMIGELGIEYVDLGPDYLVAKMPVDHRTRQPMGILHGGASVVLAETVGSMASNLLVDLTQYYGVGLEINANHMRKVTEGYVYAVAKPLHIGKSTHVWEIRITDEQERLVCASRLTVAILSKPAN
jgi:1,4-dihydroxy-2-naphthoyl-CoA hydrolase